MSAFRSRVRYDRTAADAGPWLLGICGEPHPPSQSMIAYVDQNLPARAPRAFRTIGREPARASQQ